MKDENPSATSVPEDDAIVSISEPVKPTFTNKNKPSGSNKAGFFTGDSMGKAASMRERELKKTDWIATSNTAALAGLSLNDLESIDEGESFDQFANRKTTYNESLYNTSYDINSFTKEQIAEAERIDREISMKDSRGNVHLAEERGQIALRDSTNEEMAYSGVQRKTVVK